MYVQLNTHTCTHHTHARLGKMQLCTAQDKDADFSISHKISTPQEKKLEILVESCCEIISCFFSQ